MRGEVHGFLEGGCFTVDPWTVQGLSESSLHCLALSGLSSYAHSPPSASLGSCGQATREG